MKQCIFLLTLLFCLIFLLGNSPPPQEFYTTHPGAFHLIESITTDGNEVHLLDGSCWGVESEEWDQVKKWTENHRLTITPNRSPFSKYPYRMVNVTTGVSARVNLKLPPVYNGKYTHWIVKIDHAQRTVILEDGSYWSISSLSGEQLNTWMLNDTIFIGINTGWLAGSFPNLLINVSPKNPSDAVGRCI